MSRRALLLGGAASAAGLTGLTLGLRYLSWQPLPPSAPPPPREAAPAAPVSVDYRQWEDLYRDRWRWDRVARGTHSNANCVSGCAWDLYIRDGIVWREEQKPAYVASNATVPDWNPRGCQKGASCSDLLIGPGRVRYPLRRVGPRGAGQWKRISWDEALDEIAGNIVDVLTRRGGEGVICEFGTNMDFGPGLASMTRFFHQLGAPILDNIGNVGDIPVGGTITLGTPWVGGSSDDWFRAQYMVLWMFNPVATRIPDAHFINEARYRGARVVTIAPDYNPSAIHTDLWLSPRPGTDAALALAACHVIIEENLYQAEYVREQTDLPFLVRSDTGRLLRESDVVPGGREDRFAWWDEVGRAVVWAPGTAGSKTPSLQIPEGVRPALEVNARVRLVSGKDAGVRTVFSLLRERLQQFGLEETSRITGIAPSVIQGLARDFARSPAALILASYGSCKNYHSDLIQRAQLLLAGLTGNIGRPGSGWQSLSYIGLEGMALFGMQDKLGVADLALLGVRSMLDREAVARKYHSMYIPGSLFHAVHGGLLEIQGNKAYGDPALKRDPASYLKEALAKGHFPMSPPPGAEPPEVIFNTMGNVLRSSRMGQVVRDTLFARARLVIDITYRMQETSRHADIVLPVAGWYEKLGLKYVISLVPYVILGDRAVPPLGESKPEWEIFARLAERIGAEARRRGVTTVRDFHGEACDLANLGERFTDRGRFGPEAEEDVLRFILRMSKPSRNITLEALREKGAVRIEQLGPEAPTQGVYSDYRLDEPVGAMRDFVEKKRPYPTLSGRQQYYIDHPWFLELGEQLPTYKEPPLPGGAHPFTLTGGHTRWSIHSNQRDHALMLRLQRGEPLVYLNNADARERDIADHDLVYVWNDVGHFVARAKISATIRPRQIHMYHAWEPFQFLKGRSHDSLHPSPMKVTQLVANYGHLRWEMSYYDPNQVDRDTRVDVRKYDQATGEAANDATVDPLA